MTVLSYLSTAVVIVLFFALLFLSGDLIFCLREQKRFQKKKGTDEYVADLERRYQKTKNRKRKNYYLFLICQTYKVRGEIQKASAMDPFVKRDLVFGIRK